MRYPSTRLIPRTLPAMLAVAMLMPSTAWSQKRVQVKNQAAAQQAAKARMVQQLQKALKNKNLNAKQRQAILQMQQRLVAQQAAVQVRRVANVNKTQAVTYLTRYGVGLRKDKAGNVVEAAFPPRTSYSYMRYLTAFPKLKSVDIGGLSYFNNRGLQYIAGIKGLESLNLNQCRNLTDTGLASISGMTKLTFLDLTNCTNISEAGILKLKPLKNLKTLKLGYLRKLDDKCLGHIAGFKNLESLDLSYCRGNITAAGWKKLQGLTKLKELTIDYTYIDDAGLKALADIASLKTLSMRSCSRVSVKGVSSLANGKAKLTSLNLAYVQAVKDQFPTLLPDFKTLESLNLTYVRPSKYDDLKAFAKMPKLKSLELSYLVIDDDVIAEIAKLKNLEEVTFYQATFSDKGLLKLKALSKLKSLSLRYCGRVTDTGLAVLKDLKNLESLTLYGLTSITSAGVANLKGHAKLKSLTLRSCNRVSATCTKTIATIKSLQSLNLVQSNWVTSTSLKDLKPLQELRELDLSYCSRITSSGVRYLRDLKKLETISLKSCTQISNIGLNYLSTMKHLREVDVNGVRVTSSTALRSLRTSLPEARVAGQPTVISYSSRTVVSPDTIVKININRDLTNAEKRAYLAKLKEAVGGGDDLTYHLIADTEEGVQFQFAPISNLQDFAGRIKFGKVKISSSDAKTITIELPEDTK